MMHWAQTYDPGERTAERKSSNWGSRARHGIPSYRAVWYCWCRPDQMARCTSFSPLQLLANKTIHLAVVNVAGCIGGAMRASIIQIVGIVIWLHALVTSGIRHANGRLAVLYRNAVRSGECAEVAVK